MVRKVTKNNYRQFYKEYYGIEFGEEFQVHHIDSNRDNNDISNLLLLPKILHNKYHQIKSIFDNCALYNLPIFFALSVDLDSIKTFEKVDVLQVMKSIYFWNDIKMNIDCEMRNKYISYDTIAAIYQTYIDKYGSKEVK